MSSRISGKVAAILDGRRMVINRGMNHGVIQGMEFIVQLPVPDIIDPDDPMNVLSGVYYTKGRLKVRTVFQGMSFADVQANPGSKSQWSHFLSSTLAVGEPSYPKVQGDMLLGDAEWAIRVGDSIIDVPPEAKTLRVIDTKESSKSVLDSTSDADPGPE